MTTIVYITKGAFTTPVEGAEHLLDGMVVAQTAVGRSVTWTDLTIEVARGTFSYGVVGDLAEERVAVIDVDNATAREALAATMWVNE